MFLNTLAFFSVRGEGGREREVGVRVLTQKIRKDGKRQGKIRVKKI